MAGRDTSHPDGPEHGRGRGGLPSPAALAFGALTGGARLVRDLPASAVRLPVRGLNMAFTVTEKVQREAAALQHRGEQLVQLVQALRGTGGTGTAAAGDDLDEIFARARVEAGEPAAVVTDLAERAAERAERVADLVESTASDVGTPTRRPRTGRPGAKPTTRRSATGPRQPAKRAGTRPDTAAEAPGTEAAAPEAPAPEAVEAGAPGTASDLAARAEQEAAAERVVPGGELSADELPLAGFDGLSIGALRSRLARLDRNQLVQLLAYERAHASRLQVVTMLENRIAKIERAVDAGAPAAAAERARAPRKAPAKKAAPGVAPPPAAGTDGVSATPPPA